RLEQQRETRSRSRPRRGDLMHAALRADRSRHARVQQRAMLEEIQMPPGLVFRVVDRAAVAPALRAGEPAPTRKIHVQIKPTFLDRKRAARHRPGRRKTKSQLEKIDVSHPPTMDSIPPTRSPAHPKNPPYPLVSARSQNASTSSRQSPATAM